MSSSAPTPAKTQSCSGSRDTRAYGRPSPLPCPVYPTPSQACSEEVLVSDSRQGGTVNDRVRSDLVLLDHPGGGRVFSVGSIAWCGCLSANGYENTVARVTGNVLEEFLR